jgi:hypothetical protein
MAFVMPGPSDATMAMARMSPGTARKISVTRMISSPTQPPKKPATMPNGTPIRMETPTTIRLIRSVSRVPRTTRE